MFAHRSVFRTLLDGRAVATPILQTAMRRTMFYATLLHSSLSVA